MLRQLSHIRPIDIRVALFLGGDTGEVSHDDYWAGKLDVETEYLMETRCTNTVNLFKHLFNLYGGQYCEDYSRGLFENSNVFIFSLVPVIDNEDSITHTGVVFHYEKTYIVVDSYANHYSLRVREFSEEDFVTQFEDKLQLFLRRPTSSTWYELTGVNENIVDDNYELEIMLYQRNLEVDMRDILREMYKDSLKAIEGPSRGNYHKKGSVEYEDFEDSRNIHRDDLMAIVLGGYGVDRQERTYSMLQELVEE